GRRIRTWRLEAPATACFEDDGGACEGGQHEECANALVSKELHGPSLNKWPPGVREQMSQDGDSTAAAVGGGMAHQYWYQWGSSTSCRGTTRLRSPDQTGPMTSCSCRTCSSRWLTTKRSKIAGIAIRPSR